MFMYLVDGWPAGSKLTCSHGVLELLIVGERPSDQQHKPARKQSTNLPSTNEQIAMTAWTSFCSTAPCLRLKATLWVQPS